MVKLLIADDESFIREGIVRTIPWEKNGVEIAGEAANGQQALEMCIALRPDIVLADIEMPVKSGLELARQLNALMPKVKVIILTAYGSSENFTSAIDVKVSSFLIKSADSGRILQAVLRAKEELLAEQEEELERARVRSIFQENQQLIKSSLLRQYLTGERPGDSFRKKAEDVGLALDRPPYFMLAARCSAADSWQTLNQFYYVFRPYDPMVFWMHKDLLVVIGSRKAGLSPREMEELLPELLPYLFSNNLVLRGGLDHFSLFPQAFRQLCCALDACFWNVEQRYLEVGPDAPETRGEFPALLEVESRLISHLVSRRHQDAKAAFGDYYQAMMEHIVPREVFLQSVDRLIVLIGAILDVPEDCGKLSEVSRETETPGEIIDLLQSMLKGPEVGEYRSEQFAAALKYIEDNYANDIKLADVAGAAYFSIGYLSRIFKAETGYTFKEWLNRVRIERAKDLIVGTSLKYYEIAEQVGYRDYKYFSTYFNKLCGCSAKEYKQKHARFEP